jgi:hypothetical protein
MSIEIRDSVEEPRGCGYRKEGGTYLVAPPAEEMSCGRFPLTLTRCPCCDQGIKPSRGWTWLNLELLLQGTKCVSKKAKCSECPISDTNIKTIGKVGLLWVGEKFYTTPHEFNDEAARMGVSRRISQIPRDFKIGETWVAFAHRKGVSKPCACVSEAPSSKGCDECGGELQVYTPSIFKIWRPTAIEYIVSGKESEENLEALVNRGFSLVRVHPVKDPELAI